MFDWYHNYMDKKCSQYMEHWLPKLMGWEAHSEQIIYKNKKKWVTVVKDEGKIHQYARINGVMTELTTGISINDLSNQH